MGFLGSLASLTKAVVDTALTPIEVVKDVVTLGGLTSDKGRSYTIDRLGKLKENLENSYERLDD